MLIVLSDVKEELPVPVVPCAAADGQLLAALQGQLPEPLLQARGSQALLMLLPTVLIQVSLE